MILQALSEYYERKSALGKDGIAPDGFIDKRVDFQIELGKDGEYLGITDLREPSERGRLMGRLSVVPSIGKQSLKHTNSGKDANLLWDNSGFALGANDSRGTKFKSFLATIRRYYKDPPPDVAAVLNFLEKKFPFSELLESKEYGEELSSGAPIISFRVKDSREPIFSAPHVTEALAAYSDPEVKTGLCLVSGEYGAIDPTHPVIKGIWGGQTSGCSLVGFNSRSFCSYGKAQSFNAPISKRISSAYTKAIQSLIDSKDNCTVISDITILAWAQKPEEKEVDEVIDVFFNVVMGSYGEDDPDYGVSAVMKMINSVKTGEYIKTPLGNFYVLGVAPSGARIAVKYWEMGPVHIFAERMARFFEDFEIIHSPEDQPYLSLGKILSSTVFENKISNVPSNLAGEVLRSILSGTEYPRTLFLQAIRRIRIERHVTRTRAAILKACINGRMPAELKEAEGIKMALDKNNINSAYRLGRLFAVLERIQDNALRNINANIRDRYYGAASSTPATVFPRLLKLKNHHLAKLKTGHQIYYETLIGEIMGEIAELPKIFNINDQGFFAIGYYHQRQALFTKEEDNCDSDKNYDEPEA